MADPALAVCGQDHLYRRIQALNLLGISWPSVMEYLNKDMVHQTHQHIQRLKVQKPVIALSKLDQLEVDLIDMSKWAGSNNSKRYAVSIIDCFSKYAWLLPITQKKTEKVLLLATKVKTKGVSTQVPKTGDYVRVSFVCLIGSEREQDLKGFCKHTGQNYSDDIYKVETTKPRKVSHNEFVISEAFVWVQGKCGPGHYDRGSGQLLPAIFYATN